MGKDWDSLDWVAFVLIVAVLSGVALRRIDHPIPRQNWLTGRHEPNAA